MCIGMFMAILDVQVVATSLPTIQQALGIEPASMTWVQTAYLVAEVVAIPLTGLLTRALTHALALRPRRFAVHRGVASAVRRARASPRWSRGARSRVFRAAR